MSLLLGVNYVGGREDGCLTSPPLEWTGLHTLFATPSQFVVALFLLPQLQLDGDVLRDAGVNGAANHAHLIRLKGGHVLGLLRGSQR